MIKMYLKFEQVQLSEHLTNREFSCHCSNPFCRITLIHKDMGPTFERLRKICGDNKIKVNSAYRCAERNLMVGGVPKSYHQLGMAIDMVPPDGISLEEFMSKALEAGFKYVYIDRDRGFCHADLRSE